MNLFSQKNFILLLATGGGVGFLPGARGTYGTAVGVLLYLVVRSLPFFSYTLFLFAFSLLAVWVASLAEGFFQEKDSSKIVIDEIAGLLLTLVGLPFHWKWIVLGFLLFRLLDILKPFPARLLEKRLPRGWGIVSDDLMVALYANGLLQAAVALLK